MSTTIPAVRRLRLGPRSAGLLLSTTEFDRARFREGWRYEFIAEFVSAGKVNQERDYVAKRAEYREIGVREYWVIDRFRRTLTVFFFGGESDREQVITENQDYESPLLPGFKLPLARLLKLADRWAKKPL
jgi:Uma2 family endonuclease